MTNRAKTSTTTIAVIACLLLVPFMVEAQQTGKVHRIGYLSHRSPNQETRYIPAFKEGLRELGYVEGKNLIIEILHANRKRKRLPTLAAELIHRNVEIIVTGGGNATLAVQRLSKTIPIVMAAATAPVKRGVITNFGRPGGNTTGLAYRTPEIFAKYPELLKEAIPGLKRMAVLWNPKSPTSKLAWESVQKPAQQLGIHLYSMKIRSTKDLDKAFQEALEARADGLYVTPGARGVNVIRLVELIKESGLPTISSASVYIKRDASLISYGTRMAPLFRRAADFVDQILKGAKPGDLPVELPDKFNLVVNMKTAKALGVALPRSILLRATRVIK